MTVLEVIQRSTAFLQQRGVDSPRLQIELILGYVLGVPRLRLYLNFERVLTEPELSRVRDMVKRRGEREPLQHILGSTSFCGLEIKCSRDALVPRPETELLAERAWQFLSTLNLQPSTVLDLGTGTGCIAIAIAVQVPDARVRALDISPAALTLARENVSRHDLVGRIDFTESDAFAALRPGEQFDLIVSNPPYLPSEEIKTLDPEVREFDPLRALDGGPDGLGFHRRIARAAPQFLKRHGKLMLEFADGQEAKVKNLFESEKWVVEEIAADYSARPRILIARREG